MKAHTLIADLRTGTLEDWNTKGLGGKSGTIAHNFGAVMESVITLQTNLLVYSRYEFVCKFANSNLLYRYHCYLKENSALEAEELGYPETKLRLIRLKLRGVL